VAEAGSGGSGPCVEGPEGMRCYGASGSITRIDLRRGTQERIAGGLPSLAAPDGAFATGAHDIAFLGRGNAHVTFGFGDNPVEREAQFGLAGASFATLARMNASGRLNVVTDLGAYEFLVNPAGDHVDSNPYGILAVAGKVIVVDAGANALRRMAPGQKWPVKDCLRPEVLRSVMTAPST
jgi:hypothetical protein